MWETHNLIITINTFDIETFTENNKVVPYCVCMRLENKNSIFYLNNNQDVIQEAIKHISINSSKKKINFYIHNLNFDGLLILEVLFKNNIMFNVLKKNLNIYKISFKYLECEISFKCSYKLIPLSLNVLALELQDRKGSFPYKFSSRKNLNYKGKCPDLEYFNSEKDYNIFKDKIFNFKEESISYCIKDVNILYKIISEIILSLKEISNNNLISLFYKSNSIPSFSHKIFFKYYNNGKIIKKLKLETYSYIKNSYFGGRCEVFGNPMKNEIIHYFDFSGMYAQCMEEKFPIGEIKISFNEKNFIKPGFYYIKFYQNNEIPLLPIKIENKLLFVNGEMEGLYWYEEINLFKNLGGVVKEIKYAFIYEKEEYVFKSFVNDFTKVRKYGGYKKILGKLIINSLYGSFGLKEEETFSKFTYSEKEFYDILENLNTKSFLKINNCYFIEIIKDKKSEKIINKENKNWNVEFHERNVAYASIITSKARIKLYKAFLDTINAGGRLLYCDTDSIFAGFKENNLNKKCGDFITWSSIYNDGCFILPKFYALKRLNEEIVKIKGIINKEITINYLNENFYKNETHIKVENELVFYKKNFELKQKYIEKILWLNKYDKRKFINEKKETKPLNIKELQMLV